MSETTRQEVETKALRGKLLTAYAYLTERRDEASAAKVRQLAGKLRDEEFGIAFCGHFSAGKSTMINRLLGENLLPSSPIPTSANLVKVKAGEAYAKVSFKAGRPRLYLAPYDYDIVKNYCKDGDMIESIEISHAGSQLPPRTVIMDTPGIDSADDAHRVATESAIHLADMIFYVMDYNHVQSELNFMFTKELTDAGKEIYLIINQVDKHSDQELSFGVFQEGAAEAFAAWGVKPADIFYTSLKRESYVHNEFSRLKAFLARRLANRDSLLHQSIESSLQKILTSHLHAGQNAAEERLRPYREVLAALSPEAQAETAEKYRQLEAEQHALAESGEAAERAFAAETNKIMANAYLTPFQTRALAESYLAACQPGFKVGWLPSKKKAAVERTARRDMFYQDIREKTKSQLAWHLRDFLLRFAQERQVDDKVLGAKIREYSIDFSPALLENAVKEGAQMSGEYVLNYTAAVANEIKRTVKAELAAYQEEMIAAVQMRNEAARARIEETARGLESYVTALEQIKMHETALALARTELAQRLAESDRMAEDTFDLFAVEAETAEVICGKAEATAVSARENAAQKQAARPMAEENERPSLAEDKMKQTAEKLSRAATLVKDLPGFAKLADELEEKAARLAHKGFTVALFGAFSAGKSSFANALLGEKVLPVSPNPTTAAINRIKPVDDAHRHGTALVKLKEARAMLEDVNHALRVFSLKADCMDEALAKAESLCQADGQEVSAAKTQHAFLRAFARGYAAVRGRMGTIGETTAAAFGDYVAQEEKSCFVEWIDLYYDCPLTRRGITLVDTPGADSINARHTGVAFEFIKNADAILFVTYYNHAFSKADRGFLIQLGRVKDVFALDKMFFVINAIDLAESEAEKELVASYVKQQLIKYGVQNPHLYPLSSLMALDEKQEGKVVGSSGMPAFEESFYHFIVHDLGELAAKSAETELTRVFRLLGKLIDSAGEDAAVKEQKRACIKTQKAAVDVLLDRQTAQALRERICQETEELTFYIRQRVFLRFNELFREAFNSNALREDGRDMTKALRAALEELVEAIGFIFAEEMRATTVRLECFKEKATAEFQKGLCHAIALTNDDLSFSRYEGNEGANLEFAPAFADIRYALFAAALSRFHQAKTFFEKGGNKRMAEEIQCVLADQATVYLMNEQARLQALYCGVSEREIHALIGRMRNEADDFYLSLLSTLDGGMPIEKLLAAQEELKSCIEG